MQQVFAPEPHSMMIKTPYYASEAQLDAEVSGHVEVMDTMDYSSNPQYIQAMDTGKWAHVSLRPGSTRPCAVLLPSGVFSPKPFLPPCVSRTVFYLFAYRVFFFLFSGVFRRPAFSTNVVAVLRGAAH